MRGIHWLGLLIAAWLPMTSAGAVEIAGEVDAQIVVGSGGALEYSVPVPIVPGTAGMQPKLTLTYNSQGGAGPLGAGWSVSGISRITRGPKNLRTDGMTGAVELMSSDALYIDGTRLIPIGFRSEAGISYAEFRKQIDDHSLIIAKLDATNNPISFEVKTKAGLALQFGGDANSVARVDGVVVAWLVRKIEDTVGNYIKFRYLNTGYDYDIEAVSYTGHAADPEADPYAEVRFEYEDVAPYLTTFIHGSMVQKSRRLTRVRSGLIKPKIDAYVVLLTYEAAEGSGRFRLSNITFSAADGTSYRPLKFAYSSGPVKPWARSASFQLPVDISGMATASAFRFAQVGPAGNPPSLLYAIETATGTDASAYESAAAGWRRLPQAKSPPVAFASRNGASRGVAIVDFDGDQFDDLVLSSEDGGARTTQAFRQNSNGWEKAPDYAPDIAFAIDGRDHLRPMAADLDADGRLDLVGISEADVIQTLQNSGAGWTRLADATLPASVLPPALVDADCDHKPEVVIVERAAGKLRLSTWKFVGSSWTPQSGATWDFDLAPDTSQVNWSVGQGACGTILLATRDVAGVVTTAALFGSVNGWDQVQALAPPAGAFWSGDGRRLSPRIADINTDHRLDILVRESFSDGVAVDLAYVQLTAQDPVSGEWWRRADGSGQLASPFLLAHDGVLRETVLIRLINNDSAIDIIDLDVRGPGQAGAYLGGTEQWTPAASYSPPLEFARAESASDTGVRFTDLNGDGLVDILYNRGGPEGDGRCSDGTEKRGAFLNRGNAWECVDGYIPPLPISDEPTIAVGTAITDINNDGFVDLLYSYRNRAGRIFQEAYLNTFAQGREGWAAATNWRAPVVVADARRDARASYQILDVNGDSRVDIIRAYRTVDDVVVTEYFQNDGAKFAPSKRNLPGGFVLYRDKLSDPPANVPLQFTDSILLDINGDRTPDFVERYVDDVTGLEVSNVYLSIGNSYSKSNFFLPEKLDDSRRNTSVNSYFFDINSDGLPDLYYWTGKAARIYLGTGLGWTRFGGAYDVPAEAVSDAFKDSATRFLDLNGDGLQDIGYNFPTDPGKYKKGAYFNTGSGWTKAPDAYAPELPFFSDRGADLGVRPIDVDANGLPDMVKSRREGAGLDQEVRLNLARRSDVLEGAEDSRQAVVRVRYQSLGEYRALVPDGRPDRVYEHGTAGAYPNISIAPAMYVVARITTDEGNGRERATRFRYGDLRLDVALSQTLGFAWKETIDESTGIVTRTEFHQDAWLSGILKRETSSISSAGVKRVLTDRQNDWTTYSTPGAGRPIGGVYEVVQTRMVKASSESWDLDGVPKGGEITDFLDFDSSGNIRRVVTTRSDGSRMETVNVYDGEPERERLGRLREAIVTKSTTNTPADPCLWPVCEQRRAEFTYYPDTLLLRSETAYGGTKYETTTTYERDSFGVVRAKILRAAAGTEPHNEETFEYIGNAGRLLASSKNGLGQSVINYYDTALSLAIGQPTRQIDENLLASRREFDPFGRLTREIDSSGVQIQVNFMLPASIGSEYLVDIEHTKAFRPTSCVDDPSPIWHVPIVSYAKVSQTSVPGTSLIQMPQVTLYDRGGNVIRIASWVYDGNALRLSFLDSEFDNLGRPIGRSAPYFSGDVSYWSSTRYDRLGRAVAEVGPDGSCERSFYSGLRVTKRTWATAQGAPRDEVTILNMRGAPLKVVDAESGTIAYTYDAGERLIELEGPADAKTHYVYDEGGNRVRMESPNSGIWSYSYDAFGRLFEQRDPKSTEVGQRIYYDVYGRRQKIVTADYIIDWVFRPPGSSCSTLVERVEKRAVNAGSAPSYTEAYEYDRFCRPSAVAVTIGPGENSPPSTQIHQNSFVSYYSYDAYGRPQRSWYPRSFDGPRFATVNTYEPSTGQLLSVNELPMDGHGKVRGFWRMVRADAAARVVEELRGANMVVARSYDPKSGQLSAIRATAQNKIQFDVSYKFDLAGNLVWRSDRHFGERVYGYDELDRLTDVMTPEGRVEQSVDYDEAGRITYKGSIGYYRYGADCGVTSSGETRPAHGVCGISKSPNGPLVERFRYNQNGAMDRSPTANMTYSSDGKLVRIAQRNVARKSKEDAETEYVERYAYGPEGEQFLQYSERTLLPSGLHRSAATFKLGLYQHEERRTGESLVSVDRYYIRSPTGIIGFVESADFREAYGVDIPAEMATKPAAARLIVSRQFFTLDDRIGSVSAIADAAGKVIERFAFDPWGGPVPNASPPIDIPTGPISGRWNEGYAGQAHLAIGGYVRGLVHMGGRVYDSRLAVFVSADSVLTDPMSSQDLNPYMYVLGNPFTRTDPTGNSWFSDFVSNPFKAIEDLHRNFVREVERGVRNVGRWIESDWREIVAVGVGVVIVVYCPPCMANPMVGGFLVGAAQAGTAAALYGGDASQVLEASMRGGAIGAIGGAASYTAGTYIQAADVTAGSWQAATAHGVAGGVTSVASGGRFESGFVSGAFTQAITQNYGVESLTGGARIAVNAAVGGVNAEIGGGNFANGAMYGAYQVMFNDWLHPPKQSRILYNAPPDRTTPPTGATLDALQCLGDCLGADQILVTGGSEKNGHSRTSLHYQNKAVDITLFQPGARRFSNQSVMYCAQTCGFTHGQYEPWYIHRGRAHWHLQTAPGARVPKIEPMYTPGFP